MIRNSRSGRPCPNPNCRFYGQPGKGNIIKHSFFRLKRGRRRRYRCKACGRPSIALPERRIMGSSTAERDLMRWSRPAGMVLFVFTLLDVEGQEVRMRVSMLAAQ